LGRVRRGTSVALRLPMRIGLVLVVVYVVTLFLTVYSAGGGAS
jgi:hypothetical protein